MFAPVFERGNEAIANPAPGKQDNRKALMQAAHATAKWRVLSVGGAYRVWFATALAYEWKKSNATRLRHEQNVDLPIRTCLADAPGSRRVILRGNARTAHLIAAWSSTKE